MKKLLQKLYTYEELFIGYALVLIATVATIQVFMRYTLGIAYDWVDECSRYMCILITFVGAGVCARYGSHFCMDALLQYVPNRFKHLLKMLANLVSTLTLVVVCYYAWIQIEKLHRFGATTPSLGIPMYVPYLPLGIFTAVIAIQFFVKTVIHVNGFVQNTPYQNDQGVH
ncbi:TRAP transporter small permease [Desulfopila aestuarii]|uniref:TRAP-type C4-dicarboxylate transport system, small permease component n=1 Tax=Desulfopila aestuarii DSM 18488 TaxID=1121416 RepID=A0A1M7XYK9_9BACT|nr:TRAP transporter small permease [Desulfopila aestuarii]SHO44123.1 TRAP-type C4-dicarboxylate transport system, small permease component [Desulfopila aestuarii DSM 18488]